MKSSRVPAKAQATELCYELHTLGWKAFQNLCITAIGEVFGQTVQCGGITVATFCKDHFNEFFAFFWRKTQWRSVQLLVFFNRPIGIGELFQYCFIA